MPSESKEPGLSLWLLPPSSFKALSALTELTTSTFPSSANFPQSPSFTPHITLTSSVPASSQLLLPSLILETPAIPEIEFGELAHGNEYFKFIFLRIKKSVTLLSLAKYTRERLLPHATTFDDALYDPHISLVYSKEEVTEKRVEYVARKVSLALGETTGWKGGRVALVDTRSRNVEEWKIVEEWSFPETT